MRLCQCQSQLSLTGDLLNTMSNRASKLLFFVTFQAYILSFDTRNPCLYTEQKKKGIILVM